MDIDSARAILKRDHITIAEAFAADFLEAAVVLYEQAPAEYWQLIAQLKFAGIQIGDFKRRVRDNSKVIDLASRREERKRAKQTAIAESREADAEVQRKFIEENDFDSALPPIFPNDLQLSDAETICLKAIAKDNDPIKHVEFGNAAAIINEKPGEVARIEVLDDDTALRELAHNLIWLKWTTTRAGDRVIKPTKPSRDHVTLFLHTSQPREVPKVKRVVEVPIPLKSGKQLEPGFNEDSGIWYSPTLKLPPLSANPTRDELEKAKRLIREPLQDFLFQSDADYAAAVACMMNPFIRDYVPQQTPIFSARAAKQGTGKDFLVNVCYMPWGRFAIMTPPASRDSDDEWRKRITTELRHGFTQLLITNVTFLYSNTLAGAVTMGTWDDRLLGGNQKLRLDPALITWAMTENNAILGPDFPRRILPMSIWSDTDPPSQRRGFKINDLDAWLKEPEHRSWVVWAILTCIRYWINRGCPQAPNSVRRMSSFVSFRLVMGGLLHAIEIPGFGENYDLDEDHAVDPVEVAWRTFTTKWWAYCERNSGIIENNGRRATRATTAFELVHIAKEIPGLFPKRKKGEEAEEPSDSARALSLGMILHHKRTGIFDHFKLDKAGTDWQLIDIPQKQPQTTEDDEIDRLAAADAAPPAPDAQNDDYEPF